MTTTSRISARRAALVGLAVALGAGATASSPVDDGPGETPPAITAVPGAVISAVEIEAPIDVVWSALTTQDGLAQWMAPNVELDLRVGGMMRANYVPDGTIGDDTTIGNRILSMQPPRMISLKTEEFPARYPFRDVTDSTWSVFLLEPLERGATRLTCTGMGYPDTPKARQVMAMFQQANATSLTKLKEYAEGLVDGRTTGTPSTRSVDGAAAPMPDGVEERFGLLARMAGGEWRVRGRWADGSELVARETADWILDGRFLRNRVFVTAPDGTEYQRYETIFGPSPDGNGFAVRSFSFDGTMSEATCAIHGDTIVFPPHGVPGSGSGDVRESMQFLDRDTFRWRVWVRSSDGETATGDDRGATPTGTDDTGADGAGGATHGPDGWTDDPVGWEKVMDADWHRTW